MHKGTSRDIYLMLWEFWNSIFLICDSPWVCFRDYIWQKEIIESSKLLKYLLFTLEDIISHQQCGYFGKKEILKSPRKYFCEF